MNFGIDVISQIRAENFFETRVTGYQALVTQAMIGPDVDGD